MLKNAELVGKTKTYKTLYIILGVATIFRVFLQMKIPLYMQAGAGYDDYLLVRYASSLLAGEWLGTFDCLTLVKTISYSVYLAINFLLGIPYPMALIVFYIFAVYLLVKVMGDYIQNIYVRAFFYLFLLYSPVMLHQENVQKIYRGGVMVCASIVVFAAFIGIYNNRYKSKRKMLLYSALASIILPFFYYLKEDGIWILPFCIVASAITVICLTIFKRDKFFIMRIIIVVFPFCTFSLTSVVYRAVNNYYYKANMIVDRSMSCFSHFLSDLIQIEDGNTNPDVWVTYDAVYMAMDESPTFNSYRSDFDALITVKDFGETESGFTGDFYIWNLRNLFNETGLYQGNMENAELLYRQIHQELTDAFDEGRLQRKKMFYPSSISKGIAKEDITYFVNAFREDMKLLATYSENTLSIDHAYGEVDKIQEMSELTISPAIWPNTAENIEKSILQKFVDWANKIVSIYQKTGKTFLLLGAFGLIILSVKMICGIINKSWNYISLWLITFGMLAVGGINFFGVQWFTRFLSTRKFYDYACCVLPVMQIIELIGIYMVYLLIKTVIKQSKTWLGKQKIAG